MRQVLYGPSLCMMTKAKMFGKTEEWPRCQLRIQQEKVTGHRNSLKEFSSEDMDFSKEERRII